MIRKLLITAGVLLLVLVLAAVALVTLVDVNRFKPQIEQFVQDRYQRSLKMNGDLALSVFPRIALSLPPSTLSEPGGTGEAASLAGARISVAVLPLLRGEVVADKIAVDALKATVERRPDGTLSIDDLLGTAPPAATPSSTPAPPPSAPTPAPDGSLPRFDIGGLQLTGSQVTYKDRQAGRLITISGIDLDLGRIANRGVAPMSLKFGFAASEPSANGEVNLKGDVVVDFDARSFGAKDLELNATAAIGTTRIDKARLKATRLSFDPSKSAVDVEGLDLAASGGLEAGPFEAKVTAPRLAVSPASAKGDSLLATISLAGAQEVKMRLEAAGIAGGTDALTIAKLAVAASTRQGERTVQADLGSPVKANLQAGSVGLTAIAGAVVINDPALPEKTTTIELAGTVSADLSKESISANLNAKAQGTALLAKVSVNGFAEPRFGVDITADQLDIDRLFPPAPSGGAKTGGEAQAGTGGGKPAPGGPAPNTPEAPIDLSALATLQLDGRLSVGSLRARGLTATDLKASVKAAKGQLDLAPVSASLYGGRLAAKAAIKAGATPAANRLNTTVDLTGVEIGPLLKDAAEQDLLEGRGNVKLVLQTGGGTVDAMKRGLDGNAALSLRDGAIKGINLAETIRSARSLLQGGQAESKASDASKKTDFTAMSVSFIITDGVASSDDLDVRSPLLRLGGEGRVDIPASSLDYTVRASVVGTSTGQGGKELADLRGVTIPVRLTGPFDRLDWRIDWESAGKEALKSRVASELKERGVDTEQLEEKAKERAKEKIGDALKGLFKR